MTHEKGVCIMHDRGQMLRSSATRLPASDVNYSSYKLSAPKWCKFLHVIQKYTKFKGLYFPHFTTFRDRNFTNFKMLFVAVVMDFVRLALIKI